MVIESAQGRKRLTATPAAPPSVTSRNRALTASRPIAEAGFTAVVSSGWVKAPARIPSIPTMDGSAGTSSYRARAARIAPNVIRSFAANIAVTVRPAQSRIRLATASPESGLEHGPPLAPRQPEPAGRPRSRQVKGLTSDLTRAGLGQPRTAGGPRLRRVRGPDPPWKPGHRSTALSSRPFCSSRGPASFRQRTHRQHEDLTRFSERGHVPGDASWSANDILRVHSFGQ
jgi:hypothetical protein